MYFADASHDNPALQAKLRHLYTLRGGPAVDLTIRPDYYELLRRLGNPHEHLPPVVHVAGTNGKGSTIAILRALLEAGGYRVHAYTSPHLLRFNERIVLSGQEIEDDELETLLDEVLAAATRLSLTFFEITTALAFTAFARTLSDILLLETGLGGRLDCTNVVTRPAATIITPIGMDHMEFLGTTLAAIAGEKAGIMKAGTPCIVAAQEPELVSLFVKRAAAAPCPLLLGGRDWQAAPAGDAEMSFTFRGAVQTYPAPALVGRHQIDNAGLALACLTVLPGFEVSPAARAMALRAVTWPGRLQRLADPAPGWELWFDGAHNEHGARALAMQAAAWQTTDGKPLHLVCGMLAKRAPEEFLSLLRPYCESLTAVAPAEADIFHDTERMAITARRLNWTYFSSDDDVRPAEIFSHLTHIYQDGRILITGSLYLAGLFL